MAAGCGQVANHPSPPVGQGGACPGSAGWGFSLHRGRGPPMAQGTVSQKSCSPGDCLGGSGWGVDTGRGRGAEAGRGASMAVPAAGLSLLTGAGFPLRFPTLGPRRLHQTRIALGITTSLPRKAGSTDRPCCEMSISGGKPFTKGRSTAQDTGVRRDTPPKATT